MDNELKESELTKKEQKELAQIYHEAEGFFLDYHNFYAIDWIADEQKPRFRELYKKENGFCPDSSCGQEDCDNCKPINK